MSTFFWGASAAGGALTVTVSPASFSQARADNSGPVDVGFTAAVEGGSGSYTYLWSVSGLSAPGALSVVGGQGTASAVIRVANGAGETVSGVVVCTVSDGPFNDSDTSNVNVSYGDPV